MALLWTEFFGLSRTQAALEDRYPIRTGLTLIQFVPGRFGGRALSNLAAGNNFALETPALGTITTFIVGAIIRIHGPGITAGAATPLFSFRDGSGSGNEQVRLDLWPDGKAEPGKRFLLEMTRGTGVTGIILDSAEVEFTNNRWHTVEVKITIGGATTGSWEVRVNKIVMMQGTNLTDFQGTGQMDRINFALDTASTDLDETYEIDGWYICDDSGSAFNDFLGDFLGEHRLPIADGFTNDWTATPGPDNFAMVDEPDDRDDDTTYVTTLSNNETELYANDRLTIARGGVLAVDHQIEARRVSAGSQNIQSKVRSNDVEANGGNLLVDSTSYLNLREFHEQNPVGPKAWTLADLDLAEIGAETV